MRIIRLISNFDEFLRSSSFRLRKSFDNNDDISSETTYWKREIRCLAKWKQKFYSFAVANQLLPRFVRPSIFFSFVFNCSTDEIWLKFKMITKWLKKREKQKMFSTNLSTSSFDWPTKLFRFPDDLFVFQHCSPAELHRVANRVEVYSDKVCTKDKIMNKSKRQMSTAYRTKLKEPMRFERKTKISMFQFLRFALRKRFALYFNASVTICSWWWIKDGLIKMIDDNVKQLRPKTSGSYWQKWKENRGTNSIDVEQSFLKVITLINCRTFWGKEMRRCWRWRSNRPPCDVCVANSLKISIKIKAKRRRAPWRWALLANDDRREERWL